MDSLRSRPAVNLEVALAILAATLVAISTVGVAGSSAGTSARGVAAANPAPGPILVAGGYSPGHGVELIGALPSSTGLSVLVGLPSQDPSGFSAYQSALYVPGSGAYHQFLSPSQIAQRYGASPSAIAASEAYFAGFGLRTSLSLDGFLLTVSGSSGAVAHAFGISFEQYRGADGRTFFSHPTAARLPGALQVSGAYGLGNVTPLRPVDLRQGGESPLFAPAASCTTGENGLSPCQIWGAYDSAGLIANGTDGAGERIGVVDTYDGTEPQYQLASDLATFDSLFGLPAPSVSFNYPVPTSQNLNSSSTGWGTEEALDLEWSHASAPGASIAFTFAPNSGVGLYLAVDWLVAHHLVDVLSLSWGEPDVGIFNAYSGACTSECNASTDGSYEILSPVLQAASVEGIGVFVATGDCGSSDGTSGVSTDFPASDPSVTAVGGTNLAVSGSGVYQGEVAWSGNSSGAHSPGCQNQGGSGGGFSPFPRPYWQAGSGVPSSPATRGTPDVSADASTGVTFVEGGGTGGVGGTSLATPIWAGFAALADQYAGHDLGQLNPAVYAILRGTNYSVDFHDIVSGSNGYSTGVGWDPVTGIGTPIVGLLVKDLSRPLPTDSSLRVLLYSNTTSGPAPLTVRFGVAPTGGTGSYPLEGVYFGDGTSDLAPDGVVTHTYSRAGVYAAVGFAADASGNITSSIPVAVVVGGGGVLDVTLTPSISAPGVNGVVTFTSTVHGGLSPYSYVYSFGDGTFLNLSSAATVAHAYGTAGGFCADVIAEDSADPPDGARSDPVPIAVGGASAPVCSNASAALAVSAEATPGVRDAPADFPSLFQVSGGVTGGGGSGIVETLTSTDPYIAACECTIFRSAGTYPISMTATDLIDDRTANETNVTVAAPLGATFAATPTFGVSPLTVHYSATVSGGYLANASQTHWNFGDGTGATGSAVEHTYTTPGFYSATGDATDQGDGNASEGFLVDVLSSATPSGGVLTATFAPAVNLSSGATIHYTAHTELLNGSLAPAEVFWNLGENGTAWGPVASQTYYAGAPDLSSFLYATVTADWAGGAPATEATLVSPQLFASETGGFTPAVDALELSASGGPSAGSPGLVWSGTSELTAPGPEPVTWSFGDGSESNGSAVSHSFLLTGNYTVNATGNDSWGDSAVVSLGVQVGPGVAPVLSVSGGPSTESGVAPLAVTFLANATGGALPYSFVWQTGDGASNLSATFLHTYSSPGKYVAQLTVRDDDGRSVHLNWTIQVVAASGGSGGNGPAPWVLYVLIGGVVAALAVVAAVASSGRRPARPPTL